LLSNCGAFFLFGTAAFAMTSSGQPGKGKAPVLIGVFCFVATIRAGLNRDKSPFILTDEFVVIMGAHFITR
jgi:hypothetical protein